MNLLQNTYSLYAIIPHCHRHGEHPRATPPRTHRFPPEGQIEDSVQRMLTPSRIVKRATGLQMDWITRRHRPHRCRPGGGHVPDVSSRAFAEIAGFDELYYMYCEDADICARSSEIGQVVWLMPSVKVIHDAAAKAIATGSTCGGISPASPAQHLPSACQDECQIHTASHT
jgi:hypothetical protein